MLLRAHRAARFVETGDRRPVWSAREFIVHCRGIFQVAKAGFQNILFVFGVAAGGFARDEFLRLARRDSEVEHQRFARQIINVVFQMLDPGNEALAVCGRDEGSLMGEIRADVAVGEDDFALVQGGFEAEFGFEAIAGIEERAEVRINGFERAKIAVEELADHFAEPGIVLGETCGIDGMAIGDQGFFEQVDLCALAAAVDALDGYEFSRWRHVRRPV